MRSSKEDSLKIGLIAGQGAIPERLVSRWEEMGLTPVIVGLKNITDPALLKNRIGAEFSIGHAGHIFKFLKQHHVQKLVMVGAMTRPNFWTIIPDFGGISILVKLLMRQRGDDSLLRFVRNQFEKNNIEVVGVHHYMPELLAPLGVIGRNSPSADDIKLIELGFRTAKQHGAEDKGQSVIVNASGVVARETKAGTNALIKSCANHKNAILVKTSKPQQDLNLDMPTIGISTIEHIVKAGFKGIAIEASKTLIMDKNEVIKLCDDNGIFLVGL